MADTAPTSLLLFIEELRQAAAALCRIIRTLEGAALRVEAERRQQIGEESSGVKRSGDEPGVARMDRTGVVSSVKGVEERRIGGWGESKGAATSVSHRGPSKKNLYGDEKVSNVRGRAGRSKSRLQFMQRHSIPGSGSVHTRYDGRTSGSTAPCAVPCPSCGRNVDSSEASVCVLDVDGACEWVGQLIAEINGHVQHVANAVLEGGEVGLNEE